MLDYQRKGCSRFGAWMGRASSLAFDTTGPLTIRKVPLDQGGYDSGGAYWGTPDNLYMVSDDDSNVTYQRGESIGAIKALFPRATWTTIREVSEEDIADMVNGYTACALWIGNDESDDNGGEPLDANYSEEDIAAETLATMKADCSRFAREHAADIVACLESAEHSIDWSQIGHDLWLTRNGHGCGFWDGNYPDPQAERLTDAAHAMGEINLYVGDDGRIYQ